jgi:hypothetical protein
VTAVHLFYPKTTVTADVHAALAASIELNLRLEAKLREVTADAMRLAEERDDLIADANLLLHERRQLRARLVECRPWVGFCPLEPARINEVRLVRDLADDTLKEVQ